MAAELQNNRERGLAVRGPINPIGIDACRPIGVATLLALIASGCGGAGSSDAPPARTPTSMLTINISGQGEVIADNESYRCSSQCRYVVETGEQFMLTGTPAAGFEFGAWSGDCTGVDTTCSVVLDTDKSVRAAFAQSAAPPPAPNEAPMARITGDTDVYVGAELQLSGNTSSDPEDDPLSFSWAIYSSPGPSNAFLTDADQAVTTFVSDTPGMHVVSLTVNDGTQSSPEQLHNVLVSEPPATNEPPIAKITGAEAVYLGEALVLSGDTSSDPEGAPLSYFWAIESSPAASNAFLTSASQVATTFVSDTPGRHVVSLTVNDGTQLSPAQLHNVAVSEPADTGNTVATVTVRKLEGATNNQTVTFGSFFREGALASGRSIRAYLDGTIVPAQLDAKTYHRDGSVRHGIVTAILPGMSDNQQATLDLRDAAGADSETVMSISELPQDFDAIVDVNSGGQSYSASAKDLLSTQTANTWLSGPLTAEWHVAGDLIDDAGQPHPNLSVHFYVRAFAGNDNVRVDVIVENNWTFTSSPHNVSYDLSISLGEDIVLAEPDVNHYRQARWRKVFWWGGEPNYFIAHRLPDLIDAGIVPKYDPAVQITEQDLQALYDDWNNGVANNGLASRATMGPGLTYPSMPASGERSDIGPLPRWQVQYLLSMDPRAKEATLGTADQAGSFPIHYRDRLTLLPATIVDYPETSLESPDFGSNPLPACQSDCDVPYDPDDTHEPSLAFLPYVLTGDFYYLEELLFWGTHINLRSNPSAREYERGLIKDRPIQDQAWSLRTLAHIDWALPAEHPQKTYWSTILQNNIEHYTQRYVGLDNEPPTDTNALGIVTEGLSGVDVRRYVGWMDDILTWSVSYLVDLGYDEAQPLLDFKATNIIERMTNEDFCWIFAAAEFLTFRDAEFAPIYDTYARLYEQSVDATYRLLPCAETEMAQALGLQPGEMLNEQSAAPRGFPHYMQIGLAAAVDSGNPDAPAAWIRYAGRMNPRDPSISPEWSVFPRTPVALIDSDAPVLQRLAALEPGHWMAIGTNTIEDVLPDQTGLACCPRTITTAWNGGAYDSFQNRLIVWGGGHAAYSGNEVYAFDVLSEQWSRLTDPTPLPVSVHTYDQIEYLPGYHQFFATGGSVYPSGNATNATWTLDLATNIWSPAQDVPGTQYWMWDYAQVVDYDPVSEKIIMIAHRDSADYDPSTRTWRRHNNDHLPQRQDVVGALDHTRRQFMLLSSQNIGYVDRYPVDDTGRVTSDRVTLTTTGATQIVNAINPGFVYVPQRDVYVAWDSGGDVYSLDPDTLVWTKHAAAGDVNPGDPFAIGYNGTFGRFRYMPSFDAFIVLTHIDQPAYLYKLP